VARKSLTAYHMKTRKFTSHATSPGIGIGQVYRHRFAGKTPVTRTWIRDAEVESETKRFTEAIYQSKENLSRLQAKMCRFEGHDQINIIESYRMLLQDDMLVGTTIEHIKNYKINAEWALDKTLSHLRLSFLNVHEDYIKERSQDINYVGRSIMDSLLGNTESLIRDLPEGDVVIVTHDFSPAEIVSLPRDRVVGLVMEMGGETSHTAIIARSLEMPAMFGVKEITTAVEDGETIILDGIKGVAIAKPGKKELEHYRQIHQRYADLEKLLMKDISLPAVTKDGHRVQLDANVEILEELPSLEPHGAEGIGLYRTEYLFLDRIDEPSEEEQFHNYVTVLEKMAPMPVTIRTIDIGADKLTASHPLAQQTNPALGLRGIRLCLKEPAIFKRQLKALLRAGVFGNLKILLPMIATIDEVQATKDLLTKVKEELKRDGIEFKEDVPLGVMIEVPAAVHIADALAKEVDFFSIGTNDLVQYSLAIDRANELVSDLYTPFHPAILKMLEMSVQAARNAGISISCCGEMAGDPLTLILLVGMGFDSLSMNAVSLPRVKKILRSITRTQAQDLVKRVLKLSTNKEVEKLVRREIGKILPEQVRQIESFFVQ